MLISKLVEKFNRSMVGYLPIKIIEGVIGIIAIKVYTSLFSLEVYGEFMLYYPAISIFFIVFLGWIVQAIARFSNAYAKDQGQKETFFSTIIYTWLIIIVAIALVFTVINGIFPTLLGSLEVSFEMVLIFLWISYSINQVMLIYLLYSDQRFLNAVLLLASAALRLVLTVVLTRFMGNSIYALFLAQGATDLLIGLIAIRKSHLKPYIKIKAYSKKTLRYLVAYGYPLIGMGLIMAILNMSDRYIIKVFFTSKEVGLYTSNYSLPAAAFTMLMVGLSRGSYPLMLEAWHRKDYKTAIRTLSAGGKYFMLFGLPAATGLLLLAEPIAKLGLGARYFDGYPVIGLVAFGMFFFGLSEYKNKGWELQAKTFPILINSLIAVCFKITINFIFIPVFGYIFAAYSTFLAFLLYFLVSWWRENKTVRFQIPKKNTWNILISCAIMSIIVLVFKTFFTINLLNLFLVVLLAMMGYFISLYALGEIKSEVKNLLKR